MTLRMASFPVSHEWASMHNTRTLGLKNVDGTQSLLMLLITPVFDKSECLLWERLLYYTYANQDTWETNQDSH